MNDEFNKFWEIPKHEELPTDVISETFLYALGFNFKKVMRQIAKGRGKNKYHVPETKYYCIDDDIPKSLKSVGFKSPYAFKSRYEATVKYGNSIKEQFYKPIN